MNNRFLYFAYGSNLLQQRIHISNPSAIFRAVAILQDYRLDFNHYTDRWRGCGATIVPDKCSQVWGVVYEMAKKDEPNLDRQEGVAEGVYKVIKVQVKSADCEEFCCRSYELVNQPPSLKVGEIPPESRLPSRIYLNTIIAGAIENKLPVDYISCLKKIPTNDFNGPIDLKLDLDKYLE